MRKLLQINSVVNYSSTGHIAENIGIQAIENGWESWIAYGRKKRPSKSNLVQIGSKIDIFFHLLYSRFLDKHGFASKKATLKLINTIETIKPDIIHIHNLHGYYINIEVLFEYLKRSNIQVVWTLHDAWLITGHCACFDAIKCSKWKNGCYNCPQKRAYPKSWIIDRSKYNYKKKKNIFNSLSKITLVPVSNWLKEIINESFLSQLNTTVIHNGINLNIFKPYSEDHEIRYKYHIGNKTCLLGVASGWSEGRRLNDFKALSRVIDKETIIILVGLTEKEIKKLPSNIIGIERTDNQIELAQLYSTSNLFINPTYEDSFPTTNLESLACGTPVATYNTGGSIEAVTNETGFIIEKGDIHALLNAINIVKKNKKNYYSKNCRDRAIRYFSYKDRCQDYILLYNSLLNNNHE